MKENQQKIIESNYSENDTTVKEEERNLILLESKTEKNIVNIPTNAGIMQKHISLIFFLFAICLFLYP